MGFGDDPGGPRRCPAAGAGSWRSGPEGSPARPGVTLMTGGGERYRAAVAVDADVGAAALTATWQHLTSAVAGAWVRRDGGAIAWVSGVGLPTLNGVWAE